MIKKDETVSFKEAKRFGGPIVMWPKVFTSAFFD